MHNQGHFDGVTGRRSAGGRSKPAVTSVLLLIIGAAIAWCVERGAEPGSSSDAPVERNATGEQQSSGERKTTGERQSASERPTSRVRQVADERQTVGGRQAADERQASRVDFKKFSDGQWVTGVGTVKRVLDDDTIPPRHQRFILEDEFGNTVLVAHNIDQAERVQGLKKGDEVAFHGEYRTNDSGGVIHWTHPDSSRRRQGGWLRKK